MEEKNKNKKITIVKAILYKIAKNIHESTFKEIFEFIFMTISILSLTSLFTFPNQFLNICKTIFSFNNFILIKFCVSYIIIKNYKKVYKFIKSKIPRYETIDDSQIEGIPKNELIDHLFEIKSFKRSDVEYKFNIPRNKYQKLAEKLEEKNILIRGENNARILNDSIKREDVVKMLEGVTDANNIKNFIRKKDNHYAFTPNAFSLKSVS